MPFQISPGVNVTEIDLTTIIPAVSTTEGAIAGDFQWGPLNQRVLIDGEAELVRTFWKPNNRTANDWFTAWNFLAYGNKLWMVRVADQDNADSTPGGAGLRAKNATASITANGFLVKNDTDYEDNYDTGILQTSHNTGNWIAKYPGDLGNTLKVSICGSAATFESTLTGIINVAANSVQVTSSDDSTLFDTEVSVGDLLVLNNETIKVKTVSNSSQMTLFTRHVAGAAANTSVKRRWEWWTEADNAPGVSDYVSKLSGKTDEMHVAIIDADGVISQSNNTVMEMYENVSKASDAKTEDGSSNYYFDVINRKSNWIRWAAHAGTLTNAGTAAANTTYGAPVLVINDSLLGGDDGTDVGNDERLRGYDLFRSPEDVDVSLILGAAANQTVAVHIINNVVEFRKDCIALFSPLKAHVVDNVDSEAENIIQFRNTLPSTSYAVLGGNWKWQYDKWNDINRYLPLNGDIGGLMVRTDRTRDPWWSPAGLNRGHIKNVLELAWNPRKADRDELYKNGINPIVSFPGEGVVLWGDKTMLNKPSAFDRINVRRLFIVLEKAISIAARFTLFEFNDEFTRARFRNMVEPFLRDVQGRRGIFAFRVVADTTNNTPEVIDRNEFIGDIYIKPARSINFIQLNFIAVRTGVDFDEIVGRF